MKQIYNKGRLEGPRLQRYTKDFICYNCKEKGHFARNCTKEKVKDRKDKEKEKALPVAWDKTESDEGLETEVRSSNMCLMAQDAATTLDEVSETKFLRLVSGFEKSKYVKVIKKFWKELKTLKQSYMKRKRLS